MGTFFETQCRTFIFRRMADEGAAAVFAFWPTLTYFCDCYTQLYDISKIVHISSAITTTVKPPSKLIDFEMLLASSPTNMTLTL